MPLTQVPASMIGSSTSTQALNSGAPIYENTQTVTASYTLTSGSSAVSAGPITINSGALDRIRITTVGGTDTFDAGAINILYE